MNETVKDVLELYDPVFQGKSDDWSERKGKGKSTGNSKQMSLSSLIESLSAVDFNPSYCRATTNLVTIGLNKEIAFIGSVWCIVEFEIQAPSYYMLCDSDRDDFVLPVFFIQTEAIKQGDQVPLIDTFCSFLDFEFQGKQQVVVNGNASSPSLAVGESYANSEA